MKYLGGKVKLAKDIANVLNAYRKDGQAYVEPFVGGAAVIAQMTGERYGYDIFKPIIEMFKEIQNGWQPPQDVTYEEYQRVRFSEGEEALKAFVGFSCSFAGKYFGGYARTSKDKTVAEKYSYAKSGFNVLMKQKPLIQDVKFECKSYLDLTFNNCLIYCDPPYANTTKYKGTDDFDSDVFWDWVREQSKMNTVIVSECNAPDDFKIIWQKETKTGLADKDNKKINKTEKLFMYEN